MGSSTAITADRVRAHAFGVGFDLCGITTLGPSDTARQFDAWIDAGYAGEMRYLHHRKKQRRDSRRVLRGTTSAIVVAMPYDGRARPGAVARYARSTDYHDVVTARLRELHARVAADAGRAVFGRAFVDTGPLLERDLARRAGLGWFGKNTMLINPRRGSFFFLGALLVDLPLPATPPFTRDHCGRCTRCLDACPTEAFVAPYVLDARRCIAYLTIELHGAIPEPLRPAVGGLVMGCDICQDVCPWNIRFASGGSPALPHLLATDVDPIDLLALTEESFHARFGGTPLARPGRRGLARNAAIALGNTAQGDPRAIEALAASLADPEPLVRSHAAWAIRRLAPDHPALAAVNAEKV
jgi:epoxyqueuosine reductase